MNKYNILALIIICLTILESIALLKNIDGVLFSGVVTAFSGIGWICVKIGSKTNDKN